MKSVLVTGASGFIGRRLVDCLLERGYHVSAISRRFDEKWPSGVVARTCDLASVMPFPKDLFNGIDAVFNCAGEIKNYRHMRALHVDGTVRMLGLIRDSKVSRERPLHWIQLSSVGAYGPANPVGVVRVVRETTPPNPKGEYEATKTEADELLLAASRSADIELTILRPSTVIGPDMPNQSVIRLVKAIQRGWFFYIGSRETICAYVHVEDVVRALIACLEQRAAVGKIYNLSNDCLLAEVVNAVCDSYGRSRPYLVIPEPLVRVPAATLTRAPWWPLTCSRIDALVAKTSYPSDYIAADLGFKFIRSAPESIAQWTKVASSRWGSAGL